MCLQKTSDAIRICYMKLSGFSFLLNLLGKFLWTGRVFGIYWLVQGHFNIHSQEQVKL